jgi:porphobilinogen synthase
MPLTDSAKLEPQTSSEAISAPIVMRPRRLRRSATLRRMVRETTLHVEDLIYPLFVMEGTAQREAVASMPGCYRYTLDLLLVEIKEAEALGIGAIALFPLIPNAQKVKWTPKARQF